MPGKEIAMQDLHAIIAANISALRTESGMTQAQLAEVLNYTDKAVSKWERAESVPDILVLKQLADHFDVTVDYLLTDVSAHTSPRSRDELRQRSVNRLIISLISVIGVWVLATAVFVVALALGANAHPLWLCYIYPIPVSSILLIVFNSVWGRRRLNFIIVSLLLWSLLLSVYLTVLATAGLDLWYVFLVGVPAQVLLLFIPGITASGMKK